MSSLQDTQLGQPEAAQNISVPTSGTTEQLPDQGPTHMDLDADTADFDRKKHLSISHMTSAEQFLKNVPYSSSSSDSESNSEPETEPLHRGVSPVSSMSGSERRHSRSPSVGSSDGQQGAINSDAEGEERFGERHIANEREVTLPTELARLPSDAHIEERTEEEAVGGLKQVEGTLPKLPGPGHKRC